MIRVPFGAAELFHYNFSGAVSPCPRCRINDAFLDAFFYPLG